MVPRRLGHEVKLDVGHAGHGGQSCCNVAKASSRTSPPLRGGRRRRRGCAPATRRGRHRLVPQRRRDARRDDGDAIGRDAVAVHEPCLVHSDHATTCTARCRQLRFARYLSASRRGCRARGRSARPARRTAAGWRRGTPPSGCASSNSGPDRRHLRVDEEGGQRLFRIHLADDMTREHAGPHGPVAVEPGPVAQTGHVVRDGAEIGADRPVLGEDPRQVGGMGRVAEAVFEDERMGGEPGSATVTAPGSRAGTPAASERGGMSWLTTLPAAMQLPSPMVSAQDDDPGAEPDVVLDDDRFRFRPFEPSLGLDAVEVVVHMMAWVPMRQRGPMVTVRRRDRPPVVQQGALAHLQGAAFQGDDLERGGRRDESTRKPMSMRPWFMTRDGHAGAPGTAEVAWRRYQRAPRTAGRRPRFGASHRSPRRRPAHHDPPERRRPPSSSPTPRVGEVVSPLRNCLLVGPTCDAGPGFAPTRQRGVHPRRATHARTNPPTTGAPGELGVDPAERRDLPPAVAA